MALRCSTPALPKANYWNTKPPQGLGCIVEKAEVDDVPRLAFSHGRGTYLFADAIGAGLCRRKRSTLVPAWGARAYASSPVITTDEIHVTIGHMVVF